ncbi:MAG TPA: hypothetical protein DGZ24_06580 [Rhodospirillaceae bacterium]|nr:hypothetical protein [Rhodospirillaceae bacterium]
MHLRFLAMILFGTLAITQQSFGGERRGFVLDWFHLATLSGSESCPDGLYPLSEVFYTRELKRLGYSPDEVEELLKDFPNGGYMEPIINRGRIDGKPVNVYAYPWSQPDPEITLVTGSRAFGFDLDGEVSDQDFVDPVTGETGIDNQLYRALGCFQSHTGSLPERPGLPQIVWDIQRDYMPAWLVEISGIDDFQTDEEIQIGFYRAFGPVKRDATGDVRSDMSMWVDPDPRMQNVVRGSIKDGVITSAVFEFAMLGNPMFMAEYSLHEARVRLEITPEGRLQGVMGGFQPWQDIYYGNFGSQGWATEHSAGVDFPGAYYALKKLADAEPDPQTGENQAISGTYWIEAVPAFLMRRANEVAEVH